MIAINYSDLRQNMKTNLDRVCNNHEPMIVTRKNGGNVVMLSQEDYESMEETVYLLRSPKNAKRLRESVESFCQGGGSERALIEE